MRQDWDQRARENARHYVVTGQAEVVGRGVLPLRRESAMQDDILNDLDNICQGTRSEADEGAGNRLRRRANDAGAGRRSSARCYAVDISAEMVRAGASRRWRTAERARGAQQRQGLIRDSTALAGPLRMGPRLKFDFAFR